METSMQTRFGAMISHYITDKYKIINEKNKQLYSQRMRKAWSSEITSKSHQNQGVKCRGQTEPLIWSSAPWFHKYGWWSSVTVNNKEWSNIYQEG